MSYYVTITRNPSPYWHSGPLISEAEWREAALAEPGIRPPLDAEEGDPDDLIWAGHPKYPAVSFQWFDGQIEARSPDELTLALLARMAAKVNANLIGEDGQRFDSSGKSLGVFELPQEPGVERPPWWKGLIENLKGFWPGRRKQRWPAYRSRVARWR